MDRPGMSPLWAGCVCVFLASVCAQSEIIVTKKVGDDVVLDPGQVTAGGSIRSIIWKDGPDIAAQWEQGLGLDLFRHYKERAALNNKTGEMIITRLALSDANLYTPEINDVVGRPVRLIVINPVPTPALIVTCNDEKTSCILTCDGNTTDAGKVTYSWNSDGKTSVSFSNELTIEQATSSGIKEFSCEMKNEVSQESSQAVPNPVIGLDPDPEIRDTEDKDGKPPAGLNISSGVTVFTCLLTAVVLVALFHRWKAGMWFFQKASMPWEADFWRKQEGRPRDAAESNGTTTHLQKDQTDSGPE